MRSALRSLREQRTRALLSALGVMVGSVAILLLVSIARGVEADIRAEVEDLGVNLLIVLPGRVEEGSMFNPALVGISLLTENLVDEVRDIDGVRAATVFTFVGGGVRHGDAPSRSTIAIATGPEWFTMRTAPFTEGGGFTAAEADEPVIVLGGIAKRRLFGNEPALGKSVAINDVDYRVVGVTAERSGEEGLFSMGSVENAVYVPYPFLKARDGVLPIDRIMIQTSPDAEPKKLVDTVEARIGKFLNYESYSVLTQQDLLKLVYRIMGILSWLLIGLTSIALFVGGVGIMTVMLMSVNERTREIGIRKTVGARRSDVFWQFLSEAVALSLLGGIAGLGLSVAVGWLLATYTPVKPLMSADVVLLALGVSILVGGVFGVIPAFNAARRDPVDALRRE